MDAEWHNFLNKEFEKEYMIELKKFVSEERQTKNIYPDAKKTFLAFANCPYKYLKVVIIGQDPYHSPCTADGMAFSTGMQTTPPSLDYIFQEVWEDYWGGNKIAFTTRAEVFRSNSLYHWAEQGVLLLNTILTVEQGKPLSHKKKGWEQFAVNCIHWLQDYEWPLVFMFWGKEAQAYKKLVNTEKHYVLEAAHPAAEIHRPGSGGFLGCKHFTKANELIKKRKVENLHHLKQEINWRTNPSVII